MPDKLLNYARSEWSAGLVIALAMTWSSLLCSVVLLLCSVALFTPLRPDGRFTEAAVRIVLALAGSGILMAGISLIWSYVVRSARDTRQLAEVALWISLGVWVVPLFAFMLTEPM